jgi:hypothetical protein
MYLALMIIVDQNVQSKVHFLDAASGNSCNEGRRSLSISHSFSLFCMELLLLRLNYFTVLQVDRAVASAGALPSPGEI